MLQDCKKWEKLSRHGRTQFHLLTSSLSALRWGKLWAIMELFMFPQAWTQLCWQHRPLRQYRGSLLRRCSEMHYGNVRLQTNATTWFSGPVASHNELTMFQFCNLFTHSWNYFMGCYILLWTPDASRPNCIMWLWCSWNQIPCLGKGFVCISTFPECIAVGHVLAIDEVVYLTH